jgi:hypothetical protein
VDHAYTIASLLPTVMTSTAERVVVAIEALEPTGQAIPSQQPQALSGLDRPAVVSILGNPGSGKSTVLHYARELLLNNDHRLVLPTLTPERFADGDTLFGWTLAALNDESSLNSESAAGVAVDGAGGSRSIRDSIDLLRRQEALASSGVKVRPSLDAATPDMLAVQLAAVTSSGLRLARGWWALIDTLVSSSFANATGRSLRQIVIMLDDADRNPEALPRLLGDARWLTVHPAIAIVVCASENVLHEVLMHASQPAALSEPTRHRQAIDTLVKILPGHLRYELRTLDPGERLPYRSLASGGSLREVLADVPIPVPAPAGMSTLLDFFELQVFGERITSNYTELLPGNARRLDQVNRGLRAVIERGGEYVAGEATRMLAESALSVATLESAAVPSDLITFRSIDDKPAVKFDLERLTAGQRSGIGVRLFLSGTQMVGVRSHGGFTTSVANGESLTELPGAFTYGLEFVKELGEPGLLPQPALDFEGMSGSLPKPGGGNWSTTLEITASGEATDDAFLPLPNWDNLIDYLLYVSAWNRLVTILSASISPVGHDPEAVTWLTFTHIALVVDIQRERRVGARLLPILGSDGEPPWVGWSADQAESELSKFVHELYHAAPHTERDNDFKVWVRTYLPWAADRAFGSSALSSRLLNFRAEALGSEAELDRANRECARRLYRRIQDSLGSRWIEGTIELLATFDRDAAREIRTMHDITRSDRDRKVQGLLDALEQRGVPEDLLGRLALQGLTEEIATGLQEIGLPRQLIAQLAEQFTPVAMVETDRPRPASPR